MGKATDLLNLIKVQAIAEVPSTLEAVRREQGTKDARQ